MDVWVQSTFARWLAGVSVPYENYSWGGTSFVGVVSQIAQSAIRVAGVALACPRIRAGAY